MNSADTPPPSTGTARFANSGDLATEPTTAIAAASATAPAASLWTWRAIKDPADRHPEYDERFLELAHGFDLIGARARGRKHKHDGTNCDDWLDVAHQGRWTVIAVADGAGSQRLSRIGAKVGAETAVKTLATILRDERPEDLDLAGVEPSAREEHSAMFRHPGLRRLQEHLHRAIDAAHEAVAVEAGRRQVSIDELSATLRLALHTVVVSAGTPQSLVVASSVGDGMTAVIDEDYRLHLLGTAEASGKYSGETEFLVDRRYLESRLLAAGTFAFVGSVRALMIMSDGIADPYFPNDPGLLRLYGDLVLNGVLAPPPPDPAARVPELAVDVSHFSYIVDNPVEPGVRQAVRIRDIARYAEECGRGIEDVLASRTLLRGGLGGAPIVDAPGDRSPATVLRLWLDAFYVRGEFDDRTLVLLQRREP